MRGAHAAFAACLLLACQSAAGRVLVEAPGMTAALDGEAPCGDRANVHIESDDPDVFAGGSQDLQALVDAVRAVLTFECPAIREIRLTGSRRGIPETVYRGSVDRAGDWRVQAAGPEPPLAYLPPADTPPGPAPGGEYVLIGVRAGMGVDEASAAVAEALGSTPRYDPRSGRMTLYPEGCPEGDGRGERSRPMIGARCLTAWFTDERLPRLYMMALEQTVGDDRVAAVEQALTDRFGEPSERAWRETEWASGGDVLYLGWGRTLDPAGAARSAAPAPAHELEAIVDPGDGFVVTTVVLTDPELAGGNAPAAPAGPVDLKL
jgi:hypothetical protein